MFKVTWLDTVDSTNSEALRRLPSLPSGTVLAARAQTAGRGQRGNTWFSEPGKNLTFSVVLTFPDGFLAAADAFALNCLCSVSVARFLALYGVQASVKWPNDIYAAGRKICGMLLENGLSGSCIAHSVMGIGINVFQTEFPNLANATSLALVAGDGAGDGAGTGKGPDPSVAENKADAPSGRAPFPAPASAPALERLLERFLQILAERLALLEDAAGRRALFDEYGRLLFRRGISARYHDLLRDELFEGTLRGVDPDGRLCVEDTSGTLRRFRFKEISYVL